MIDERQYLLELGQKRIAAWLMANSTIPQVSISIKPKDKWHFSKFCAYYRNNGIHICPEMCAKFGRVGRSWSWPGYKVDHTPYGVLAHELGHHVDRSVSVRKSAYGGNYSKKVRITAAEPALTSYCPNTSEWFAEMFRLYVTNPNLLCALRPRTYHELSKIFYNVVPRRSWDRELIAMGAPQRTVDAARRQIKKLRAGDRTVG